MHESHQSSSTATADTKQTTYTYDQRGRLLSESTSLNGSSTAATVAYTYDNLGKLITKTYGNGVSESLNYNIQGWQTTLTASKAGATLYAQELRYYNPTKGSAAQYNGNISEWNTTYQNQTQSTYGFAYDSLSRLNASSRYDDTSTSPQTSYTERGISYDKNGNIKTLQRYTGTLSDNFTYNYTGNKLNSLSGSISASYTYDSNGNMASDGRKNLQIGRAHV